MSNVSIGGRTIGDGEPCFIIAEAGCNHNQSLEIALGLVDMAVESESDIVKFQSYVADDIYSKKTPMMEHFRAKMNASHDATMYDLIKATELPRELERRVVDYCREQNIPFMSTPFGLGDVDVLESYGVPAYKVASFEMTHFPLLQKVGETGKPIILSTGMSTLGDIEKSLNAIGRSDNIILLHCVSSYPADPEECNLRVIETLKRTFGCPVGFSDHTPGIEVSKLAIAVGANVVEKHVTVDQTLPGPDHHFSLTREELCGLVAAAREINTVLGSPHKFCTPGEQALKRIGRRTLCAATDIRKGSRITPSEIAVKRPGTGIATELADVLIGAVANRDIEYDEPLTWEMFVQYADDAKPGTSKRRRPAVASPAPATPRP